MIQLVQMTVSVEKKTDKTTFLDNFKSSRPELFLNIWENSKENILGELFLLVISIRIYYHECFPWSFLKFSEEPFCRTLPVSCFSNSLKPPGWMTVIYFFFGHFSVFWVFFTLVKVTLELLAINVEKLRR